MSLGAILGYAEQVPNWAPPERFLPNADYGRVGALKLAENIFLADIKDYCAATNTLWGKAGEYHFYILGHKIETRRNEFSRISLADKPKKNNFSFGKFDPDIERDGPLYFRKVIDEISEAARIYGFSPQTLVAAVLTIMDNEMTLVPGQANSRNNAKIVEGYSMALMNYSLLESLWGIRAGGYPATYRKTPGGGYAARKDYGGFSKGRKGKKKRRRYR